MDSDSDDPDFKALREKAKAKQAAAAAAKQPSTSSSAAKPLSASSEPSSPARGAGAQLKASSQPASPSNKSANDFGKNIRKDPTGKTVVEVIAYEKYVPEREYRADVQKAAKYTKKWVPRSIVLQDQTLGYSMVENGPVKHSMTVKGVVRGAEKGNEPFSLICDVIGDDKKPAVFIFKVESKEVFDAWWLRLSQATCADSGAPMPKEGLPLFNPRTGIPFVDVPLDLLQVFEPLDRLCLHFFHKAMVRYVAEGKSTDKQNVVFAGDLCLYVTEMDANMKRCIPIKDITKLLTVAPAAEGSDEAKADKDNSTKLMTVGVQCQVPEYDLFFQIEPEEGERLIKVLLTLHHHHVGKTGAKLARSSCSKVEVLKPQLSLEPGDFYRLKIALPMSKKFLLKLIDDGVRDKHLAKVERRIGLSEVQMKLPDTEQQEEDAKAKADAENKVKDIFFSKKDDKKAPPAAPALSDDEKSEDGTTGGSNGASVNPLKKQSSLTGDGSKKKIVLSSSDDDDDFKRKAPPSGLGASSPLKNAFGSETTANRTSGFGGGPSSVGSSGAVRIAPGIDKMQRLLVHVGLPQYYAMLCERGVDWDVFSCMDALDLKGKGVVSVEHQIIIENALNDPKLMAGLKDDSGLPPPMPGGALSGAQPPPPPPPNSGPSAAASASAAAFIDDEDL